MLRRSIHYANTGDSVNDEETQIRGPVKIIVANVNVHVPKTWDQKLAGSTYYPRASRDLDRTILSHRRDAPASDDDGHVLFDSSICNIDDPNVSDCECVRCIRRRLLLGSKVSRRNRTVVLRAQSGEEIKDDQ